ncbi:MAG: oxidoreductase coenzyme F420-dependent [Firmicutes bacterium]|nr:oxidoreductase coenzyme F420-dependent [Bacillota bacterium]
MLYSLKKIINIISCNKLVNGNIYFRYAVKVGCKLRKKGDTMRIGIIGTGRMGKELVRRLADKVYLVVFDRNPAILKEVAKEYNVSTATGIEEVAKSCSIVILAIPDKEVSGCIRAINKWHLPISLINIATNISQSELEQIAAPEIRCINVKIVGHAGEMALGLAPVILVSREPKDLAAVAKQLFAPVGQVVIGDPDVVRFINTIATEQALAAAVNIEEKLLDCGISDDDIIRGAIRQVGAGVMKAYADQELGPFARELVRNIWGKGKEKLVD